jgi:hypothetical protein
MPNRRGPAERAANRAAIDERRARAIALLEAYETVEPRDAAWSDEDRAWADRVAVEAAGVEAPPAEFVAQRADHALQRLLPREPRLRRWLEARPARPRWALAVAGAAFAFGFFGERLDAGPHINLLSPPLWGVVAWNVVVYAAGLAMVLAGSLRPRRARPRPLLGRLRRTLGLDGTPPLRGHAGLRLAALWTARHAGLSALRLEALLHVGAAALAIGLVASLYVRGLVRDYRVDWESTFLSPAIAHGIVTTLLAPASHLSGLALPDVASFAALRASADQPQVGAPAADWIHLLALTLGLIVVLPRAVLAAACAAAARWRASHCRLPLDEPYFGRIARLQRGAAARVDVFPYARTPSARTALALRALATDALGARLAFDVAPTTAYGGEDAAAWTVAPATTHAVALFDLSATPEAETHGRFVAGLASMLAPLSDTGLAVVVDEAGFRERFGGLPERLEQRRAAWRAWGERIGLTPCSLDLEAPPGAGATAAFAAAFVEPGRIATPP